MKKIASVLLLLAAVALVTPGCLPKSVVCASPDVFCAGLVTDGGKVTDNATNQAAWAGLQQAKSDGSVDAIANIETVDSRDYEENIRTFTNAGYDVVITVGPAMADATRTLAGLNPKTYFIGVDQDQSSNQQFSPNLVGLVFRTDQIGYLAGALAEQLTKTGQIGAVLGSDALTDVKNYGLGFQAGAASIDPNALPIILYHNDVSPDKSLNDPEWGATQANSLMDQNVDIVFGAGGTTGSNALVAAVMRGAFAIGADTDEYYALPVAAPHLYSSILKMIAPGVADLIKAAKDAQAQQAGFPGGNFTGDVGLAPYHDMDPAVPDAVKARMKQINQDLLTGDLQTGVP